MCTVVIEVPATRSADGAPRGSSSPAAPVRLLAVRDEDPERAWDGPGAWWPGLPGVVGVRDRLANGAWLAARSDAGKLSVVLNRAEDIANPPSAPAASEASDGTDGGARLESRGGLVLASVDGRRIADRPGTAAFNLVEISSSGASLTRWDRRSSTTRTLEPGVHMIAHDELDDPRTARIERWLPEYRRLASNPEEEPPTFERWTSGWLDLLRDSARLDSDDDTAIIRDNRTHGYATRSLLVCVAEVHADRVRLASATLARPGEWDDPRFVEI